MSTIKLSLAALLLGASLTPALAEPSNFAQSPLGALEQSQAARPAVVEGRQAAPVVATGHETGAARYLDNRQADQDR